MAIINPPIYGTTGDDLLMGMLLSENFFGLDGNDTIRAGGGDDTINGGLGDDQLFGDAGNDKLFGNDGADILNGFTGDDLLAGAAGNDKLYGGDGKDALYGGADNDVLSGGNGDDGLAGGDGVDNLNGGMGNDFMVGGLGKDLLTGGAGTNSFWWYSVDESGAGAINRDVIADFKVGVDTIHLLGFGVTAADLQFTSLNAGRSTVVGIDFDADGLKDFEIQLNNVTFGTLSTTDFVL